MPEALREMVANLVAGQPVEARCECEGKAVPLPDFIAGNLLLLAQEAVTNALKHAQPRVIHARLSFRNEEVSLTIEDDGRGFDPAAAPGMREGHFGLQGMRERVKRLGGVLAVESKPAGGTRIMARVPTAAVNDATKE